MKSIILLLFVINTVFSGKCPPKEVVEPCKCDPVSNIKA